MDLSSGSANKSGLNPNEKAALMSNLKQQLQIAQAEELLQQIGDKCFKMCIQKPGSSLSSSEQVIWICSQLIKQNQNQLEFLSHFRNVYPTAWIAT